MTSSPEMFELMRRQLDQQAAAADAAENDDGDEKTSLDVFIKVGSNLLLFFLIYGLSATVQVKNMREQITNRKAIFTGVAMQFFIMPILGFLAVLMLDGTGFTRSMGISLLVVTASPGGSFSNWWCSLFNAELALSVAMTSVSSILSIGLLPLNLFFYSWLAYSVINRPDGEEIDVIQNLDFGAIFLSLGVVLGAIITGLYSGYRWDNETFHSRANKFGSICGLGLVLFSAFLGSGGGSGGGDDAESTNFWSLPWSFYFGVAFPCVVGIALANCLARSFNLSHPESVAIAIECCYQNVAIATSVAASAFTGAERTEAVSVPLFYGVVEAVLIGVYCVFAWKMGWTKAPSDEKICIVIAKTYEVSDEADSPRPSSGRTDNYRDEESAIGSAAGTWENQNEKAKSDRNRMYSSDLTATTTNTGSPPRSPDTSMESISPYSQDPRRGGVNPESHSVRKILDADSEDEAH